MYSPMLRWPFDPQAKANAGMTTADSGAFLATTPLLPRGCDLPHLGGSQTVLVVR